METFCDALHSIDDENPKEKSTLSKFSFVKEIKEEPVKKLMNKSLVDCRVILNETKKSNTNMNSYENVGILLKPLKQDAEKRINSRRKNDLSFTTGSFLKPSNNYNKVAPKEKILKGKSAQESQGNTGL